MSHDAYQSYQTVHLHAQTAQASPVQLVLILMDGLLDELARARAHIEARRYELKAASLEKCVSIINGLSSALDLMSGKDIGSLVVMEHGDLVGMLTFREVIQTVVKNGGSIGKTLVRTAMDDHPLTCTMETDMDEVRRMMLDRHARYMPVMDHKMLMGVISFYDVARAVVDSQNFENKMLKAYIRDWPEGEGDAAQA